MLLKAQSKQAAARIRSHRASRRLLMNISPSKLLILRMSMASDGQDFYRDYKLLVSGFIIDGVITSEEQEILCDYLAEKNLDFDSPSVIKVRILTN